MEQYFVKSFEEDYATKTLKGNKKITLQTIKNIVETRTIRPNTKSFGQKKRLSTTILSRNYLKTYRPQGIIFRTSIAPDYILPFDLVLLSDAKNIVVHYYRIKDNLHVYYNHQLIKGYTKFIFKNIGSMIKEFSSPKEAWRAVNAFRKVHGHEPLPLSKYRLVEYNEAVFLRPVTIEPVALFGYHPKTKTLAKHYRLPYFVSAKKFYERASREGNV